MQKRGEITARAFICVRMTTLKRVRRKDRAKKREGQATSNLLEQAVRGASVEGETTSKSPPQSALGKE
jgi:hypothetical protein